MENVIKIDHCSTPSTVLRHGLLVNGHSQANALMAVVDAFVKLSVESPRVEASLKKDAQLAECPKECQQKLIGIPILHGVSFSIAFDAKENDWRCTIGIAGEIDVTCETPETPIEA